MSLAMEGCNPYSTPNTVRRLEKELEDTRRAVKLLLDRIEILEKRNPKPELYWPGDQRL